MRLFRNILVLVKGCPASVGLCAITTAKTPIHFAWLSNCNRQKTVLIMWDKICFELMNGHVRCQQLMKESHSKVTVPEIHLESHMYKHLLEDNTLLPCSLGRRVQSPHCSWLSTLWNAGVWMYMKNTISISMYYIYGRLCKGYLMSEVRKGSWRHYAPTV